MFGKQKLIRSGGVLALAVLVSSLLTPVAAAAASNPTGAFNFTVSPPSVAVETSPGVPVTFDVRIQNQSTVTENVKATIMKFSAEGETGLPNLQTLKATDEFGSWAQVSPATFSAEPNEWKTVHMTITPPKSAAFGYYYAVVFSRQGADAQTQKGRANLLGAVASLVLLDVKAPGAIRKVSVNEFSTSSNSTEFLPVNFNVRLHNSGNTHVGVSGTITISKNGKLISQIDVNSSKGYILPKSNRNFSTKWEDGTPAYKVIKDTNGKAELDASGNPKQKLVWDNFSLSKLRIGKYDARLVMIYNDGHGDVSTQARLSFWVIPWRIIISLAVVVLLILAGLWAVLIRPIRSRYKKKRIHAGRRF